MHRRRRRTRLQHVREKPPHDAFTHLANGFISNQSARTAGANDRNDGDTDRESMDSYERSYGAIASQIDEIRNGFGEFDLSHADGPERIAIRRPG